MLFSALFRKNISSLDDLELIGLIKKNNQRAIGELFKRYAALVMGLCIKYMKNVTVAEDMMMDIFEKLPNKVQKHEITNFKSWLYSVSRNECLMELRKTKKLTVDIEKALLYEKEDAYEKLQLAFEKEKELIRLEKSLATLKEDQKNALTLFYIENKSYDQVSEQMNISIKKVKSLIQNGKRNLKLKLEMKE